MSDNNTDSSRSPKLIIIGFLLFIIIPTLLLFSIFWFQNKDDSNSTRDAESRVNELSNTSLKFNDSEKNLISEIEVEVVATPESRAKGLMYREELAESSGMLFIFEENSKSGFWMKNTLIPLDMIFVNENKEIVDIIENAQPCKSDFCKSYYPNAEYLYVVEVNGGYAARNSVETGDFIEFTYE